MYMLSQHAVQYNRTEKLSEFNQPPHSSLFAAPDLFIFYKAFPYDSVINMISKNSGYWKLLVLWVKW